MLKDLVNILENATELHLNEICYLSIICFIIGKFVIYPLIKKFFRGML